MSQSTRRGFLSVLGVGAATAAVLPAMPTTYDPERKMWFLGKKTISIPRRRIMSGHQIGILIAPDRPYGTYMQAYNTPFEDYIYGADFRQRYTEPALVSMRNHINDLGFKNFRFVELPLPKGVYDAVNYPSKGGMENVRHVTCYDIQRDQLLHRLDVLIEPAGIAA